LLDTKECLSTFLQNKKSNVISKNVVEDENERGEKGIINKRDEIRARRKAN
jgi:hypothetical protein